MVANDGVDPVVGTFTGLGNGAIVSAGPKQFRIYYTGGSGNDVVLQPYALPMMVAYVNTYGGNGNGVIDPNECNVLLVTLYATHANLEDLDIYLIAPDGTSEKVSMGPYLNIGLLA